jgi:hypothetical protein
MISSIKKRWSDLGDKRGKYGPNGAKYEGHVDDKGLPYPFLVAVVVEVDNSGGGGSDGRGHSGHSVVIVKAWAARQEVS